ncbi:MAG TPA: hypothetical protein VNZ52_07305 [Candidatus Thermoplasmatota archaeon]|nr:hypothetical protein [Candidatus Thermoplasmatota archaeon]
MAFPPIQVPPGLPEDSAHRLAMRAALASLKAAERRFGLAEQHLAEAPLAERANALRDYKEAEQSLINARLHVEHLRRLTW